MCQSRKVICVAGVEMKDKIFNVQNVIYCKCGKVKLQLLEIDLKLAAAKRNIPEPDGCKCSCGAAYIGIMLFESKYFRPVDEEGFADQILAEISGNMSVRIPYSREKLQNIPHIQFAGRVKRLGEK